MNVDLQKTLTALLDDLGAGDEHAWARLLPSIYDQLRDLASRVAGPGADAATTTPTALVHEAWAKLAASDDCEFADRQHFFAVAALTMRQILVDHARHRRAQKRGGGRDRVTLSGLPGADGPSVDLMDLDTALTDLEKRSPRQARIVELRFFAGLTVPEVAECLDLSVPTIESDWRLARAWLGHAMNKS